MIAEDDDFSAVDGRVDAFDMAGPLATGLQPREVDMATRIVLRLH